MNEVKKGQVELPGVPAPEKMQLEIVMEKMAPVILIISQTGRRIAMEIEKAQTEKLREYRVDVRTVGTLLKRVERLLEKELAERGADEVFLRGDYNPRTRV